jgi:hypothetical protein
MKCVVIGPMRNIGWWCFSQHRAASSHFHLAMEFDSEDMACQKVEQVYPRKSFLWKTISIDEFEIFKVMNQ